MNRLKEYVIQNFALDIHGHHGLPHWERVRERGLALAEVTGANKRVIEMFAYLHDSCRENEYEDPDHGHRASVRCRGLALKLVIDVTDEELALLSEAIKHHSEGRLEGDITVQTCWDADRLDLGRVGITPDARYLCTQAAKDMLAEVLRQSTV